MAAKAHFGQARAPALGLLAPATPLRIPTERSVIATHVKPKCRCRRGRRWLPARLETSNARELRRPGPPSAPTMTRRRGLIVRRENSGAEMLSVASSLAEGQAGVGCAGRGRRRAGHILRRPLCSRRPHEAGLSTGFGTPSRWPGSSRHGQVRVTTMATVAPPKRAGEPAADPGGRRRGTRSLRSTVRQQAGGHAPSWRMGDPRVVWPESRLAPGGTCGAAADPSASRRRGPIRKRLRPRGPRRRRTRLQQPRFPSFARTRPGIEAPSGQRRKLSYEVVVATLTPKTTTHFFFASLLPGEAERAPPPMRRGSRQGVSREPPRGGGGDVRDSAPRGDGTKNDLRER